MKVKLFRIASKNLPELFIFKDGIFLLMKIILVFVFTFFILLRLNAQEFIEKMNVNNTSQSVLNIESFAYPLFFDNESHSKFKVGYEFDSRFLIELQSFYDTYRVYDVSESRLRIKKYFTNKLYFLSGIGVEEEIDKHGFRPPPLRIKIINGFGYEMDEKFSLEARHDLHFNRTNFGNYGTPNLFSLSGKYKF